MQTNILEYSFHITSRNGNECNTKWIEKWILVIVIGHFQTINCVFVCNFVHSADNILMRISGKRCAETKECQPFYYNVSKNFYLIDF